ncbi:hypothetical protein DXT91_09955 [Agrobacterium tumefaciens]|nr:hypothetical protein [Agrobacterium tumefaciens]
MRPPYIDHNQLRDVSPAPMKAVSRDRLLNANIAQIAAGYVWMSLQYLTERCQSRGGRCHV